VIVGREGWTDLPEGQRRTIPRTVAAIRSHPELGRRLFWFQSASDADLDQLYRRAHALIGASYGEGFGIPLIEAASYGLPLLVRDLPVFREVTRGQAFTFPAAATREQLAAAIADFLGEFVVDPGRAASLVAALEPQSWRQSADQLVRALGLEPGLEESCASHDSGARPRAATAQPRMGLRLRLKRRLRRLARRVLRSELRQLSAPVAKAEATTWLQDLRPTPPGQPKSLR